MGRTEAVIPLLGRPGHAEAGMAVPGVTVKPPDQAWCQCKGDDARETRMRLPNWVRLPVRTVRVRLTVLYALLFLFSGALLLAIASGVTFAHSAVMVSSAKARSHPQPGHANTRIHLLQSQVAQLQSQVTHLQSQVAN